MQPQASTKDQEQTRSASAITLCIVAVLVFIQFMCIIAILGVQLDGAHLVDINGLQRMRTQRIAYLTMALQTGHVQHGEAAQLRDTAEALIEQHADLLHLPFF